MAAVAYNIKKYLKFTEKLSTSVANQCQKTASSLINQLWFYMNLYKRFKNNQTCLLNVLIT